jgi:hypothetical protein
MTKDHVICNNCGKEQLIEKGLDKCPICSFEGALMWVDTDKPEVEVD